MSGPCVIFDIDGTLSDPAHRLHHVSGSARNWDAFFDAMADDGPQEPIIALARILRGAGLPLLLCSGRPEKYRDVTEAWLTRHGVPDWADLCMRPDGDFRQDTVVKAQMLDRLRAEGWEPQWVIDDRPSVVAMWREAGLTCLQCRDWDERTEATTPGLLTLMVGPSGAGKSHFLRSDAAQALGILPSQIVSSDGIREELCGDFLMQSRNDEVFSALHGVVKARVRGGLATVVDATNLRRKDRLAVVALAPSGAPVRYLVIDRPMEEKRRDAGWRANLPIDLIAKHDQTFRSQLKDILAGDNLPNVTVVDLRNSLAVAA